MLTDREYVQPEATPDTAPQAAYVDPAFMVASAALAVGAVAALLVPARRRPHPAPQPQTPVLAVEAA